MSVKAHVPSGDGLAMAMLVCLCSCSNYYWGFHGMACTSKLPRGGELVMAVLAVRALVPIGVYFKHHVPSGGALGIVMIVVLCSCSY